MLNYQRVCDLILMLDAGSFHFSFLIKKTGSNGLPPQSVSYEEGKHLIKMYKQKVLFAFTAYKWVCLKIGYIPNEIAIFHRDNDH